MPAANTEGEILTIKEVAEYLKVTERTIYRLAGAKKIPAFKEHLSRYNPRAKGSWTR